jgi:hypothetical protein
MRHLISATLTEEAAKIHAEWAETRSASKKISDAIVATRLGDERENALRIRIVSLSETVEALLELFSLSASLGLNVEDSVECVRSFRHRYHDESLDAVIDRMGLDWSGVMSMAPSRWEDEDESMRYIREIRAGDLK